jgi:hypothetical protein
MSHHTALEDEFLAAAEADDVERADRLAARLDALDDRPPRLLDAALAYAGWGWRVFPLKPGTKTPATRHGFHDATTDPQVIRAWWKHNPAANIGLPTGHAFDVLDVDFRHGAALAWVELRDSLDMPAAHGIAATANGGLHVLLLPQGLGNHAGMAGHPGLDYRGAGGYIVAAPSELDRARRWVWTVKPSPIITGGPLL